MGLNQDPAPLRGPRSGAVAPGRCGRASCPLVRLRPSNRASRQFGRSRPRWIAAAIFASLAGMASAQEPTCDLQVAGDGYVVCYESGYVEDAEFAREILDLTAQRLRTKYGPADPFDLEVKLYPEPTDSVYAGRTYFDGSSIHYLTPSAPERNGRTSSLGLPLDSSEYHYKTLTHEYFHAFHRARSSHSFGWGGWFREGLAEFEGIFGTAPHNGPELYDLLIEHVYENRRHRVFCCRTLQPGIETITTTDVYNAGAAILKFLEDRFGAGVHVRLLTGQQATFEDALAEELTSHVTTVSETFDGLREWLSDRYGQLNEPHEGDYTPSLACTGRYSQRTSGDLSFEVRILNNAQRPASHEAFQQQYRPDASQPWTTRSTIAIVPKSFSASNYSTPLFTSLSSPPFQWRARSCPRRAQTSDACSNWSNTINWTVASCASRTGSDGGDTFIDHLLRPGSTPVRAVHFMELRSRIDALRARTGLGRFTWTDPVLRAGVTRVRLMHLMELRSALTEAYVGAGRSGPRWTDPAPGVGTTPIKAVHLTELRAAVVALE